MKKISLKDVKKGLKRDEMRAISGGCGSGTCIMGACYGGWECLSWGGYCINGCCTHP